jgi:Zinc finger C-x8-C-x5-C-x3-H type (and similar)
MTSSQVIISRKLHSPEYKEKYKTELCRNWLNGFCSFETKCVFAHGQEEIREKNGCINEQPVLNSSTENSSSPQLSGKKRLPVFVELSKRSGKEND